MPDVLIVLPTYNEADNLPRIVPAIHQVLPEAHVLVVDDGSPDGTGRLADELAARDPRVHVLHRTKKEGLGRAYLAGFAWALAHDYRFVFEMDADFSHQPRYLAPMLEAARGGADVVIASRYRRGGGTEGWTWKRKLISRCGGLYARAVLRMPVTDPTGGFKCFRREVLEALPFDDILSTGFGFQIELNYRCHVMGFRLAEVPIVFPDRKAGASKMSGAIFQEALVNVWRLRFDRGIRASARKTRGEA
jgi:dolichol-phosphate mannosyltransferase